MGSRELPTSVLEQYKLLWNTWNAEMRRFWMRFNVLFGLEVAAGLGIAAKLEDLFPHKFTLGFVLIVMTIWSIITLVIVIRAKEIYVVILEGILEFEEAWPNDLFALRTVIAVADRGRDLNVNKPLAMFYAGMLAIVLFVVWALTLVHYIFVVLREEGVVLLS